MIKLVCYYGLGVEATSVPQASRRDSDSEVVLSRLSVKGWAPGDPRSRPATRPRAGWTLLSHREKEENPKEQPRPRGRRLWRCLRPFLRLFLTCTATASGRPWLRGYLHPGTAGP